MGQYETDVLHGLCTTLPNIRHILMLPWKCEKIYFYFPYQTPKWNILSLLNGHISSYCFYIYIAKHMWKKSVKSTKTYYIQFYDVYVWEKLWWMKPKRKKNKKRSFGYFLNSTGHDIFRLCWKKYVSFGLIHLRYRCEQTSLFSELIKSYCVSTMRYWVWTRIK